MVDGVDERGRGTALILQNVVQTLVHLVEVPNIAPAFHSVTVKHQVESGS